MSNYLNQNYSHVKNWPLPLYAEDASGSGSGEITPDVYEEVISLVTLSGGTAIADLLTIDGVSVGDFYQVNVLVSGYQHTSTGQLAVRFRKASDSSIITTNYVAERFGAGGEQDYDSTGTMLQCLYNTNTQDGFMTFVGLNMVAPTIMQSSGSDTTNNGHIYGLYKGTDLIDGIRFLPNGAGVFTAGYIHVQGYKLPASRRTVTTYDYGSLSPATSFDHTFNSRTTQAYVVAVNVGESATGSGGYIQLGEDSIDTGSNYSHLYNAVNTATSINTAIDRIYIRGTGASADGDHTITQIMNLNTLAPVGVWSHTVAGDTVAVSHNDFRNMNGLYNKSAANSVNTMRIGIDGGVKTWDAGIFYVLELMVPNTVSTVSLNSGAQNVTLATGLTKKSIVNFSTADMTSAGTQKPGFQFGVSGTFLTGAADYNSAALDQNTDSFSEDTDSVRAYTAAAYTHFSMNVYGLCNTAGMNPGALGTMFKSTVVGGGWDGGTLSGHATRETALAGAADSSPPTYDDVRLIDATATNNFTGGTCYVVAYKRT